MNGVYILNNVLCIFILNILLQIIDNKCSQIRIEKVPLFFQCPLKVLSISLLPISSTLISLKVGAHFAILHANNTLTLYFLQAHGSKYNIRPISMSDIELSLFFIIVNFESCIPKYYIIRKMKNISYLMLSTLIFFPFDASALGSHRKVYLLLIKINKLPPL